MQLEDDSSTATALVTIEMQLPAKHKSAADYATMARATSTARAYGSAMRNFATWCEANNRQVMPAIPEDVADYLTARVNAGVKVSTLQTALAAIASAHRLSGHKLDTKSGFLAATWGGIRRERASEQKQAEPLSRADLLELLNLIGTASLVDIRDRALLAFGLMSGRRRSELAGLDYQSTADRDGFVKITAGGIETVLRRSKSANGEAKSFLVLRAAAPVAVAAVETWVASANIEPGTPLFRGLGRWMQVSAEGLCDRTVADIIKRRVAQLARSRGMTPAEALKFAAAYSGHSLRVGIAIEVINRGGSHENLADHLGHASTDMTRRYSKRAAKGRALVDGVGV